MNILFVTIFLFITAVAIGLYLVFLGLHKQKRSPGLGLTHASLALVGIIVLATLIYTGPKDILNNVAAFFLFLAVVGGGMVFALHEDNKPPSMAAVTTHAIMGVIGISLLIIQLL
jgi:FtsH-binding integral membrane protein